MVGESRVNAGAFADDIALIAQHHRGLQFLLDDLAAEFRLCGMKISAGLNGSGQLSDPGSNCRMTCPRHTSLSIYDGGLGIVSLELQVPLLKIKRIERLWASDDPVHREMLTMKSAEYLLARQGQPSLYCGVPITSKDSLRAALATNLHSTVDGRGLAQSDLVPQHHLCNSMALGRQILCFLSAITCERGLWIYQHFHKSTFHFSFETTSTATLTAAPQPMPQHPPPPPMPSQPQPQPMSPQPTTPQPTPPPPQPQPPPKQAPQQQAHSSFQMNQGLVNVQQISHNIQITPVNIAAGNFLLFPHSVSESTMNQRSGTNACTFIALNLAKAYQVNSQHIPSPLQVSPVLMS
ncbi:hypothetical protein ACROYT_G014095 [Oculina patagonica]